MARHRTVRGRPSGRRVAARTRPRYKRVSAAGGAVVVTLVAVLGGMGVLPVEQASSVAATGHARTAQAQPAPASPTRGEMALTDAAPASGGPADAARNVRTPAVPADSGTGKRIVFAMGDQRVWLVDPAEGSHAVRRTYLVSGSLSDNLQPGTYSVYSKSAQAWGIDDSGTMRYMVRFAHGPNAAIGFHDIPVLNGSPLQSRAQLGSPQSHGCIRQWRPDALALWDFAPVGTKVVVVA